VVPRLIRRVDEEVEHRPVMPDPYPPRRLPGQQIRDHPPNPTGAVTQPPPCLGETDIGYVEHSHI